MNSGVNMRNCIDANADTPASCLCGISVLSVSLHGTTRNPLLMLITESKMNSPEWLRQILKETLMLIHQGVDFIEETKETFKVMKFLTVQVLIPGDHKVSKISKNIKFMLTF